MKMDESVLNEKSSFKILGLTFCCNWIGVLILSLLLKKIGALIHSVKFVSPEVALCISINLPYNHAWNTVVMSGLVLLVGTWL